MPKKRETAGDIETKLKRMRARKVGEAEFSTSQEYSGVYRFVVESLDKGKKTSHINIRAKSREGNMHEKTALVCGAGGFIGSHLVKRLKGEGLWVRGVDLKYPEFSKTAADDFVIGDLRDPVICRNVTDRAFDEVYQLAADMGGRLCLHWRERCRHQA